MSEAVGQTIPEPLHELLDWDQLGEYEGFTLLLLTVRADRWPHLTILSLGEVVALDDRHARLALGQRSTAVRCMTRRGRATLAGVVGNESRSLRLLVYRPGDVPISDAITLARLAASAELATSDSRYAELLHGVRFKRHDVDTSIARWAETHHALPQSTQDARQ